jgi:hypothetical protein
VGSTISTAVELTLGTCVFVNFRKVCVNFDGGGFFCLDIWVFWAYACFDLYGLLFGDFIVFVCHLFLDDLFGRDFDLRYCNWKIMPMGGGALF